MLAEHGGAGRPSAVLSSAPGTGGVALLWTTYNTADGQGFVPSCPPAPRGKPTGKPSRAGDWDAGDEVGEVETAPRFSRRSSGVCWGGPSTNGGGLAAARMLRGYRSAVASAELLCAAP